MTDRADALDKMLRQRFSRSAPIEEALMGAGMGKRPLPSAEECRTWAVALGVPEDVREHIAAKGDAEPLRVTYRNWRNEVAERAIIPTGAPRYGVSEWHTEPQWLLPAFDVEKGADREFALKDFGASDPTLTRQLEAAKGALEKIGRRVSDGSGSAMPERRLLEWVSSETKRALATLSPTPAEKPEAVPVEIACEMCDAWHVDEGEWATRLHKTHQCQSCGHEWRPFPYATFGVAPAEKPEAVETGRIGYYAPGNYNCLCAICGCTFEGDKRAVQCRSCAVKRAAPKPEAVETGEPWVIRKGGYFYRPNAQGYTINLAYAWHVSEAEAKRHINPDPAGPVTAHPASEFAATRLPEAVETGEPVAWRERVDDFAKWLHDEVDWPEYPFPGATWPEHAGDTGQRGNAFVKIVPADVVSQFREIARRGLIAAAPPASTPPAQPCPTCEGRGEIGGFVNMESGYQTDPCPTCAAPDDARARALEELPTRQEAAEAAKVLLRCNGHDLSVWTDDVWPDADYEQALRAIVIPQGDAK